MVTAFISNKLGQEALLIYKDTVNEVSQEISILDTIFLILCFAMLSRFFKRYWAKVNTFFKKINLSTIAVMLNCLICNF